LQERNLQDWKMTDWKIRPTNTPTVPTTTTPSSWHRLLPARRPQRRCQEHQLLQTHHYGVAKYVCWHRWKALPWCPVACGHARFCKNCARRVADDGGNCPLCVFAAYTFALVLLRHFPVRHFPVMQIPSPVFCWSVIFHSCKFQSPGSAVSVIWLESPKSFNGSHDLTTPLLGMVCRP